MSYKLGTRSLQSLSGVHPDMVAVVKRAIEITGVDFTVIEGIRNINRQRELTFPSYGVVTGRAFTMHHTLNWTGRNTNE